MRKYLPILVILGVLISSFALAETTILTGEVTKIEANSFTIVKNINWLERLTGLLRKPQPQPIVINVTNSTKFYLRTSQTAGFTEGSFQDLKEKDHVVVTADKNNDTYTALEVKIAGRFIPNPKPKPPIPEIKQCQTDTDCTWCGMACVNKSELAGKACPQVMPREGTACQCVNNRCMVVPLTNPPMNFQNKAQVLQEMERIRNQIKALEQRLKELEKLLKTMPATSSSSVSTSSTTSSTTSTVSQ